MKIDAELVDQARDDLILATAVALERLIEVISQLDKVGAIRSELPVAQGRLIATITRFAGAREGKL